MSLTYLFWGMPNSVMINKYQKLKKISSKLEINEQQFPGFLLETFPMLNLWPTDNEDLRFSNVRIT